MFLVAKRSSQRTPRVARRPGVTSPDRTSSSQPDPGAEMQPPEGDDERSEAEGKEDHVNETEERDDETSA